MLNINKYLNNQQNNKNKYNELNEENELNKENEKFVDRVNESHIKLIPEIKIINNKFKNLKLLYNSSNNHYRFLKRPNNFTKYGYVTIIFCDNSYLPGILTTGFYIKYVLKTKYDIICLVQDRLFYENDSNGKKYLKFKGISNDDIENIKKIYDVVIGIDLLHVNFTKKNKFEIKLQYAKIPYYCTKLLCLGLSEYSKLIYYDGSTLIYKNIDYLFDIYKSSHYRIDKKFLKCKRGLIANFFMFIPQRYYIYKGIYLTNNYDYIFKNLTKLYTKDEDIIYYTVYPNWNKELLNDNIFYTNATIYSIPFINKNIIDYDTHVELFMAIKPFMYPLAREIKERNMFENNLTCYKKWDIATKHLLKEFPDFEIYYNFIKTFRLTNF